MSFLRWCFRFYLFPTMTYLSASASTILIWSASNEVEPLVKILANKGCRVIFASSKDAVIERVIRYSPDILLISLQTSGTLGYELCRSLRSLEATSLLPIVFVGARHEQPELIRVLRCGGSDYLQMPVEEEESWLRLSRYLSTVQVMRRLQTEKETLNKKVSAYNQMIQQQEAIRESLAEENRNLQRLAFVDGLTQIANRRSFNQTIAQLWQNAYRLAEPLSLLLCDIDYFKRYNDTYGHPAGDRCLYEVAQAIVRGAHRQGDYVARYGGEEFAILLPSTPLAGAQQVTNAVQKEVEKAKIAHKTSLVKSQVSLSIGICTLVPDSLKTPHEVLVHGADEALYTAKLRGRNMAVANTRSGLVSVAGSAKAMEDGSLLGIDQDWQQSLTKSYVSSESKKLKTLLTVRKNIPTAE